MITPQYGTGFEFGTLDGLLPNGAVQNGAIETGNAHTGTYALRLSNSGWALFNVTGSPSSLYIGVWAKTVDLDANSPRIEVQLTDDTTVGLRYDSIRWDAYVSGSKVADGTIETSYDEWQHVELFVSIAGAGGSIQSRVDGIADIDYTGDTQPDTSTIIEYVKLGALDGSVGKHAYFDDLVFGSSDWPGDIRFDVITPESDAGTNEWDLSTGSDHYALVDEIPASDADYLYTGVDGEIDQFGMTDWDDTDKVPLFVVAWARAVKDEALDHQVKLIASDGVDTVTSSGKELLTTYKYVYELMTTAPDGGAWADADIDALQVGVESVIVS